MRHIFMFKLAATLPINELVKLLAPSTKSEAGNPKNLIQFCTKQSSMTFAVQSLLIGIKTEYREKMSTIVRKLSIADLDRTVHISIAMNFFGASTCNFKPGSNFLLG